jgi:hypothetical protein
MSACHSISGIAFLTLIRSRTNQIEDLLPLVDAILRALETIQPGQTIGIPLAD